MSGIDPARSDARDWPTGAILRPERLKFLLPARNAADKCDAAVFDAEAVEQQALTSEEHLRTGAERDSLLKAWTPKRGAIPLPPLQER
jgi:hypothetical protein